MTPRVLWIDSARGVALLLIVVMHVTITVYTPIAVDEASRVSWSSLVNASWPGRLTVVFLIAGVLNGSAIRTGLRSRKVLRAVWTYLWIYLVWQLLYTLLTGVGVDVWTPNPLTQKTAALLQLIAPTTVLRFILALAVWTVGRASAHRVRPAIVLAVLGVVSIGSWVVPGLRGHDQYLHILQYGLYFAIGVYGAHSIRRLVEHRTVEVFAVSVVALTVGLFIVAQPANWSMPVGSIPAYVGGAGIVMALCRMTESVHALTSPLVWVGQRTLLIYVTHLPVASALVLLPFWSGLVNTAVVGPLTPLIATGIAIAVVPMLQFALRRTWGKYLWTAPPLRALSAAPRTDADRA